MNYSIDMTQNNQNSIRSQTYTISQATIPIKIKQDHFKPKKSKVKLSSFSWNKVQQRKYISFLKTNGKLFSLTPKERTQIKINVMMSCTIKSRTSSQCHSHHQKMIVKYGSIEGIIQSHAFLFTKEKTEVDAKILNSQKVVETNQFINIPPIEKQSHQQNKQEPLWWRYLDLLQNNDEPFWDGMDFFTQ